VHTRSVEGPVRWASYLVSFVSYQGVAVTLVGTKTYLVSSSGQMSLPADARRRWKLDRGGPVAVLDLGNVVVVAPGERGFAAVIDTALSRADHLDYVTRLSEDDDLATT
jgi:hypothetical protein